ncbi:PqqD family protein [Catellatospora tritici]|uniref:PqqD family protein n=1 Tax=Catellatospora tritici TaxID=2851566 RepID=UPI001C2D9BCF|nr:PqqD family protein [Catellatospora tritici]MBV1849991.1 PqqD family protein [Catellatospora tritici]
MTTSANAERMSRLDDLVALPQPHVRIRNLSGTIVLGVGDDMIELPEVSEAIWRAMAPDRSVLGVAQALAQMYDEPETEVLEDVRDFLGDLHDRGFVKLLSRAVPQS